MPSNNRSPAPKFIIGACLILMGVVLALEQLGVSQAYHVLRFWPAALIVLGLAMLQRTEKHSALRALILIGVGTWLLLNTLGLVSLDLWEFIVPLLLVFFGARIMMRNQGSGSGASRDLPGMGSPTGTAPTGQNPSGFDSTARRFRTNLCMPRNLRCSAAANAAGASPFSAAPRRRHSWADVNWICAMR